MKASLRTISTLLLSSTIAFAAHAAPRVDDSTISWPADGWYQVLSAEDYSEVCAGDLSCQVEPGRYIVINHSTGERFENIVVRDKSATGSPIFVRGNVISWPDNGWYQVLRAGTYENICDGGRQCTVTDGVYTVINHTSNIRYRGILIETPQSDQSEAIVDDSDNDGLEFVEEVVIPMSTRLDAAAPKLLESMAGYQVEQTEAYLATLATTIIATAISTSELEADDKVIRYLGRPLSIPSTLIEYACSEGGSLFRESAASDIESETNPQTDTYDYWRFEQCTVEAAGTGLLSGTHVLTGIVTKTSLAAPNEISGRFVDTVVFDKFSMQAPQDNALFIDAKATTSLAESTFLSSVRSVAINTLTQTNADEQVSDLRDVEFQYATTTAKNGDFQAKNITVSGSITSAATDGVEVSVTTIAPLNRDIVVPEAADRYNFGGEPASGALQLSASDGSEMNITTSPDLTTDFEAPLNFDYSLLTADGEIVTGESVPFPAFSITAQKAPLFMN